MVDNGENLMGKDGRRDDCHTEEIRNTKEDRRTKSEERRKKTYERRKKNTAIRNKKAE